MPDTPFFSSEDEDLQHLSQEEFEALWLEWFEAAQATNDLDEHVYTHGVVAVESGWEHLLPQVRSGLL